MITQLLNFRTHKQEKVDTDIIKKHLNNEADEVLKHGTRLATILPLYKDSQTLGEIWEEENKSPYPEIFSEERSGLFTCSDHVTIGYLKEEMEKEIKKSKEIRAGENLHQFWLWQRINLRITGESIALLP